MISAGYCHRSRKVPVGIFGLICPSHMPGFTWYIKWHGVGWLMPCLSMGNMFWGGPACLPHPRIDCLYNFFTLVRWIALGPPSREGGSTMITLSPIFNHKLETATTSAKVATGFSPHTRFSHQVTEKPLDKYNRWDCFVFKLTSFPLSLFPPFLRENLKSCLDDLPMNRVDLRHRVMLAQEKIGPPGTF